MKFKNEQNEIFWKNVSEKHLLNQQEYRVLISFVTDSLDFKIAILTLNKRLKIQTPHISRALKGLSFCGILIRNEYYELNPSILTEEYEPLHISSDLVLKKRTLVYAHLSKLFS